MTGRPTRVAPGLVPPGAASSAADSTEPAPLLAREGGLGSNRYGVTVPERDDTSGEAAHVSQMTS